MIVDTDSGQNKSKIKKASFSIKISVMNKNRAENEGVTKILIF